MAIKLTCEACGHTWMFSGTTGRTRCKCGAHVNVPGLRRLTKLRYQARGQRLEMLEQRVAALEGKG